MSESAAESDSGVIAESGTDQETGASATDGSPEDGEAEELLSGMLDDPETLRSQLDHWKAMARKHEGRAKANSQAAAELEKIKQANMSELEKAQAAAAKAAEERDAALNTHARVMAAAAHNLPVELIDHLGSGTEDEINERAELFSQVIESRAREIAEQILSRNGISTNGGLTSGRPLESLRPGSAPAAGSSPQNANEWFRALLKGDL